jgi:hypothetical protein
MSPEFKLIEKVIKSGEWRYLGQRCPNISPSSIPIAGISINAISDKLNAECYRVGKFHIKNAFLIVKDCARFLYVRPEYKGYLNVAKRVFLRGPWAVDFDHSLSKRIAVCANYSYVLLLRVPPGVNRQHGVFEKKDQLEGKTPDVCFADDRVLDKWLGRPPKSRNRPANVLNGYSYKNITTSGLTLKQRGRWAYAIGIEDEDLTMEGLSKFTSNSI